MNKNKVIFTLVVILAFAVLIFSGCQKTNVDTTPDKAETKVVTNDDSAKEEISIDESFEKTDKDEIVQENVPDAQNISNEQKVEKDEKDKILNDISKEKSEEETNLNVCTLVVRCDSVLDNLEKLNKEKTEIIPKDGIIFSDENIEFSDGESVFDLLVRELKKNKIHFDFVSNPQYNSAYIKGISNLYEFDCGSLSGWLYKVNGTKPIYGCSQYKINKGDKIEFYYSCDLFE
ncbi:MAG: DUF4430 domain-containing protein [Ruminococcaceae bacterium]|nr:DUF4430 domain-containing protein [Oscillospiraceae bacterium]